MVFAIVASASVFGLIRASAATLGGITTVSLGADAAAVSSCDTDGVSVTYTNTYDSATGVYRTSAVAVAGINTACNTKTIFVTLKDSAGTSLGVGSATVSAGAATVTLSPTASSTSVTGVAIVIS